MMRCPRCLIDAPLPTAVIAMRLRTPNCTKFLAKSIFVRRSRLIVIDTQKHIHIQHTHAGELV